MSSTNWTLSDEHTLAEYVPMQAFKGILEQRIGISPDHAALLMRDGKLEETFIGAHFSVGGLWQSFKSLIGGKHALRLLVADLKPFPVEGVVEGITRDQVQICASVTIEFQLNPEKPQNILGLMNEREALLKTDIYQRLIPHLQDRVFNSVLVQVDANEIRGNTALQDRLQADIMLEAERLFGDLGLMVRAATVNWGINDEERTALEAKKQQREQQILDQQFAHRKLELERENEAREFVLRSDLDAETLKATSEDTLKHLFLNQELVFADARDVGVREQQLKKLNHDIEVLNTERQASYRKALEDTGNAVEQSRLRKQLQIVELEIAEMNTLQRLNLERLEEEQKIALAEKIRKQQLESLTSIDKAETENESNRLLNEKTRREMDRDDRTTDHDMEMDKSRLSAENELDKLKLQGDMTPDQLLALSAGLSPDIARVFAERAKSESMGADKQQELLREMLELSKSNHASSEQQSRFYFEKGVDGMAAASQGKTLSQEETTPESSRSGFVECPKCHHSDIKAASRFCHICGHKMRT